MMNLFKASELLRTAYNLKETSFYSIHRDNNKSELCFRIYDLSELKKDMLDKLVNDLNRVIEPVLESLSERLVEEAKNLVV